MLTLVDEYHVAPITGTCSWIIELDSFKLIPPSRAGTGTSMVGHADIRRLSGRLTYCVGPRLELEHPKIQLSRVARGGMARAGSFRSELEGLLRGRTLRHRKGDRASFGNGLMTEHRSLIINQGEDESRRRSRQADATSSSRVCAT